MSGPQGTLGLCGLWAKEEPRKVSWLDHTGHSGTQEKGRAHPRGLQGASNQELWGERGWSGRDTAFPWPRHGGRGTEAQPLPPGTPTQPSGSQEPRISSWCGFLASPSPHPQHTPRQEGGRDPTPGPNCNPSSSEPGWGRGRQSPGMGDAGTSTRALGSPAQAHAWPPTTRGGENALPDTDGRPRRAPQQRAHGMDSKGRGQVVVALPLPHACPVPQLGPPQPAPLPTLSILCSRP